MVLSSLLFLAFWLFSRSLNDKIEENEEDDNLDSDTRSGSWISRFFQRKKKAKYRASEESTEDQRESEKREEVDTSGRAISLDAFDSQQGSEEAVSRAIEATEIETEDLK